MTKYERLAELIGISIEDIETDFDEGVIDILITLNEKNYFTNYCCEGHLNNNNEWNGYISFVYPYSFKEYPHNFSSAKNKKAFYWDGKGEESRQEFLKELTQWANILPVREIVKNKSYTLWGKNKSRANSKWRILKSSSDYDEIRIELNKKATKKFDVKVTENVIGEY